MNYLLTTLRAIRLHPTIRPAEAPPVVRVNVTREEIQHLFGSDLAAQQNHAAL